MRDNLTLTSACDTSSTSTCTTWTTGCRRWTVGARGAILVASDEQGTIHPDAQALLPLNPVPYVTSADAGWGRGRCDPSAVRLAPRTGFALTLNDEKTVIRGGYGIFLNQWAYSVQRRSRGICLLLHQAGRRPVDVTVPVLRTSDILSSEATGTVGASIMDYEYNVEYSQTWSGVCKVQPLPSTMLGVSYMGTWTLGADNATLRTSRSQGRVRSRPVAPCRNEPDQRHPVSTASRSTTASLRGRTPAPGSNRLQRQLHALHLQGRCLEPGPTESESNVPQNVRNIFDETGEWARSSFDHRHQMVASGVYELPSFSGAGRAVATLLGGWRVECRLHGTVPVHRSRSTSVSTRPNIGAGPPSVRISCVTRTSGGSRTPTQWFDTSAFALQPRLRSAVRRAQRHRTGLRECGSVVAKIATIKDRAQIEFRLEAFNLLNRANFDLPAASSHAELRENLQRQAGSRAAIRTAVGLLECSGSASCDEGPAAAQPTCGTARDGSRHAPPTKRSGLRGPACA